MNQTSTQSSSPRRPKRRGAYVLSTILFALAIGFAGVAVYLFIQEQDNNQNQPTPPPAVSGEWGFAQIRGAFDNADMSTEVGRTTGHANQINGVPGQALTIDGVEVYIFIFTATQESPDPIAEAERIYAEIDESTLELSRLSTGALIGEGETLHAFQGSNVIAVMAGGTPEQVEQVKQVIEGLI